MGNAGESCTANDVEVALHLSPEAYDNLHALSFFLAASNHVCHKSRRIVGLVKIPCEFQIETCNCGNAYLISQRNRFSMCRAVNVYFAASVFRVVSVLYVR